MSQTCNIYVYRRCCEHDIYEGCCIVHHESIRGTGRVNVWKSYGTNKIHTYIRVGLNIHMTFTLSSGNIHDIYWVIFSGYPMFDRVKIIYFNN